MITKNFIKENYYSDSVTLMLISSKISELEGVVNAAVMMGSDYNKSLMTDSGLLLAENKDATPNDMIICIIAEEEETIDIALNMVNELLDNKKKNTSDDDLIVKTQDSALKRLYGANLAVISIPGRYARDEAMKALDNNLNVLLFSDNVTLKEEIELKEKASEKGLFMMGPDCGTAIINGVALGFANVVERGSIGMIAAAGTGLQEVTSLVDRFGGGVSQAIGTGGRDLKDEVGGKMMLMGLDALIDDPQTKVIVLISKPPSNTVMEEILKRVKNAGKQVVICFLGSDSDIITNSGAYYAKTLEDAANIAVNLDKGLGAKNIFLSKDLAEVESIIEKEISMFKDNQKYVRGLYTGGTLSYESMLIMEELLGDVYSNVAVKEKFTLEEVESSIENTVLDMGDDYFTDGRPHPMIDPSLRNERIKKETLDSETSVILFDCVIGYGSHEDPAATLVKAIEQAKNNLSKEGRYVSFVGSVCGTDMDPQIREEQEKKLKEVGAIMMSSNAQAARMACLIADRGNNIDLLYENNRGLE